MAGETERFELRRNQEIKIAERTETFTEAGQTEPLRFQRNEDGLTIQVSGTATEFTAIVERCTDVVAGNWAPADNERFTGDLSAGIPPRQYHEPSRGFWRVRVEAISGGSATVVLTGEEG